MGNSITFCYEEILELNIWSCFLQLWGSWSTRKWQVYWLYVTWSWEEKFSKRFTGMFHISDSMNFIIKRNSDYKLFSLSTGLIWRSIQLYFLFYWNLLISFVLSNKEWFTWLFFWACSSRCFCHHNIGHWL